MPQLWVDNDDDTLRAKEIIDAYLRSSPSGGSVKCPNCGEENPASFDLCWNCGAGLEIKA
jgi:hypothetical protein